MSGARALLPVGLVRRARGEPWLWPVTSAGLAAHPDRAQAVLGAVIELIERDALINTWLLRASPHGCAMGSLGADAEDLCERLTALSLRARCTRLLSDAPITVAGVLIGGPPRQHGTGALGLKGHTSLSLASVAAAAEAMGILWHACRYQPPAHMPETFVPSNGSERAQYWAEPSRWSRLERMWAGPALEPPPTPPTLRPETLLDLITAWAAARGREMWIIDLLPAPLVRRCGFHVVRAVVPWLSPFWLNERERAYLPDRLREVAHHCGVAVPANLNDLPHPFA